HLDAAAAELLVRAVDVIDDELKADDRAGSGVGDAGSEGDRARRARRRELNEPDLFADRVVVVGVEPGLVHVERLGPVDVGYGYRHQLEFVVHDGLLFGRSTPTRVHGSVRMDATSEPGPFRSAASLPAPSFRRSRR